LIEILPNVFGQEAEDQIAVFLKQSMLAAISSVGVGVSPATAGLAAVQFNSDP
jgi:hypothetical protein